jgi:hypothetical protein
VVAANAGGAFSPFRDITTLSSRVVVPVGEDRDEVLERLQSFLRDRFGIDHVTLQIVEARSDRVQVGQEASVLIGARRCTRGGYMS